MDSNRARTGRRQLVLYLGPEEHEDLTRAAEQLGETKNAVVRWVMRDFLRKHAAERRSAARTAIPGGAPHADRVKSITVNWSVPGKNVEDVCAMIRAGLVRDYPGVALKMNVERAVTDRRGWLKTEGSLKEEERAAVNAYVAELVNRTIDEYLGLTACG